MARRKIRRCIRARPATWRGFRAWAFRGCALPTGLRACLRAIPRRARRPPWAWPPPSAAKTAEENGLVIGREDRALGIDVSLQPFVNIDRDLEFGRGYNTFGEDPFLTGEMGVAEIKGIQSQHVMAQIKHFVATTRTPAISLSTIRRCMRSMWRPSMRPSGGPVSRRSCAPTTASTAPSPAATSPR